MTPRLACAGGTAATGILRGLFAHPALAVTLCALILLVPARSAHAQDPTADAPIGVGATGAVLWDPADDRVLWGRAATEPRPMASTTKIMTALLAVEAGTLGDEVTVSARAARVGSIPGGASLGLEEGQRLAMGELLQGLLLRSGNDAAVAVAEHVAGTESAFVALMNARAEELDLADTNFLNASGLTDDPRHHASPLDLARLAEVALADPRLAEWVASPQAATTAFGIIENRNELLTRYPGADGVKTGFTTLAGRCLVASAERDGRELISVVLGSEDHFADSAAILNHGFIDYRRIAVGTGQPVGTWRTSAGATSITPEDPLARTVAEEAQVATRVHQVPSSAATVAAGERVGTVELVVDGDVVTASPAIAGNSIEASRAGVGASLQDGLRGLARLAASASQMPQPAMQH